jgi:hypothetical protein
MRHEDDRLAFVHEPFHGGHAPLLKVGVADGKDLVQQEDVRIEIGGDGEPEPHVHAGRVVLDRHVDEMFEARIFHDRVINPSISARVRPWIDAFSTTFSRPVSSGWNPTPSSIIEEIRAPRATSIRRSSAGEWRRPASGRCSSPIRSARPVRPPRRDRSGATHP